MADDTQVVLDLVLDVTNLKKSLAKTEGSAEKAGKKAGKNFSKSFSSSSSKGMAGLKKTLAGFGAVFAGAFAVRSVVRAAQVQEDAVNRFNVALTTTGKFTEQASKDFQEYASSLQSVTRFGDEAILENAALIQSLGDLDQKGLKRATKAAIDMSEALKIDLASAATLVGKAAAGEVGSFSRFGVSIKKGADTATTFSNALTALEGKFGGTAEKQVQTFSGRMEQLGNTFGDVQEAVGELITKSPGLNAIIGFISDKLSKAVTKIQDFGNSGGNIDGLVKRLLVFAKSVNEFVVAPVEVMVRAVKIGFSSMTTGVQTILHGMMLGIQFTFGNMISFITGALEMLPKALQPDGLLESLNGTKQFIDDFTISTGEVLGEFADESSEKISGIFDPLTLYEKSAEYLSELERVAASAGKITGKAAKAVDKNMKKIGKSAVDAGKTATFAIDKAMAGGISKGIQDVTNAIMEGENAFAAFGDSILGIFGDLAIQLGSFFIAEGIAIEAMNAISGTGAVIAGIGLIALGTIMKSFSGSGGSSANTSTSSGGVGTAADFTEPAMVESFGPEDVEEKVPDTTISVNVQGDILDSDESGSRIVSMINEAYDKQGIVISRGAIA